MTDLCEVVITAPDPEWLLDLTRQLVTEGLCASAHNFTPVRSIYRWRGEIHERTEGRASLHTRLALVDAIVQRVKASHPYEVPGISARPIVGGNPDYLEWMADETATPGEPLLQLSLRFQGRANARRRRPADVAEVGKVARRKPVSARATRADLGPAEGGSTCRQGRPVTGAAWATPAASRAGALRRGRPRRQVRAPERARTGNPPQRTRELASARTASGHEHQGDEAEPQLSQAKGQTLGTTGEE